MIRRFNCVRLLSAAILLAASASPVLASKTLGWLEIEKAPLEKPPALAFLKTEDAAMTLREIIDAIDEAAERSDLDGLVIRLREPEFKSSQVEEIGAAIQKVRKAGKRVHLFTETYGPAEIMMGSYTDEAIVQAGGEVTLPGIYMEEMFLADALAMVGLKADMVQVGDYKGASEMMANSAPSKAWEENLNQLLDGMYDRMRTQLKQGRRLTDEQLNKAMENAWLITPQDAVKLKLVDAVVDRLDLDDHLKKEYGDFDYAMDLGASEEPSKLDLSNPFALLGQIMKPQERVLTRDSIALLNIDGAIVDGESSEGGPFGGGGNVGSLTMRSALKEIEDEDKVKGLVIRIDSPGGSAIASESIWLGVRRVAAKKPVWISVGSMAASGGYYISVAGDKIYVDASSIVGSIGVVGGKYTMGGLYNLLKVNVVPHARGPRADLFSTTTNWTEAQRDLIRSRMTDTYNQFVDRVKKGRKQIEIAKTGEGRLFTGERAIEMKMADKIGGIDVALDDMASNLHLQEGAYDVVPYPAPKSLGEAIGSLLDRFVQAPDVSSRAPGGSVIVREAANAIRELVGPRAWPAVRDSLNAMQQMKNEPVLLVAPRVMIFK